MGDPYLELMKQELCGPPLAVKLDNYSGLPSEPPTTIVTEFIQSWSTATDYSNNLTTPNPEHSGSGSTSFHQSPYVETEQILYSRVIVAICALGVICNLLNLIILIPKGLQYAMGRIEKFAYSGLIALAVSDMLFCACVIPHGFVNLEASIYTEPTFSVYYNTYSDAIINVFALSSTWLTVTMAVGRYVAVCYPLRARVTIGMTFAKRSLIVVFSLCVLYNIPRFWAFRVATIRCDDGSATVYFTYYGPTKQNQIVDQVYSWSYLVLGILLPLSILLFCNFHLIRALRRSHKTRIQMRARSRNEGSNETNVNVTLILVVIVISHISLVSPAELINFWRYKVIGRAQYVLDRYNLAVAIANTLQSLNFALNFILYYVINPAFRRATLDLVLCRCRRVMTSSTRRMSRFSRYSSYSAATPGTGRHPITSTAATNNGYQCVTGV